MIFALLLSAGFIISCTNEPISNIQPNITKSDGMIPSKGVLSFFYNGEYYSSEYEMIDTTVIFINDDVSKLSQKLKELPNVATYYREDGSIEYFDNPESLQKQLNFNTHTDINNQLETRGFVGGTLKVYEDINYSGRVLSFTSPTSIPKLAALNPPPMLPLNFNDIISSIKLTYTRNGDSSSNKCVATFFRDENYNSNSFWIAVSSTMTNNSFSDLRSLPLYPGSSRNFNDNISSIKLEHYVQ